MNSLWYNYKIPSINYPCYPRIKAKQRTVLKDINKLQRTFNTQSKFKIYLIVYNKSKKMIIVTQTWLLAGGKRR